MSRTEFPYLLVQEFDTDTLIEMQRKADIWDDDILKELIYRADLENDKYIDRDVDPMEQYENCEEIAEYIEKTFNTSLYEN